jgi:hypothetical protein
MVNIARVATNGGTLNFVMAKPVPPAHYCPQQHTPSNAPVTVKPMKRSPEGISIRSLISPQQRRRIEPIQTRLTRSMPAVKTTNVIPVAMQMFTRFAAKHLIRYRFKEFIRHQRQYDAQHDQCDQRLKPFKG